MLMAVQAFTLIEPKEGITPLVVDSPHSGRNYSADFTFACPLALLRQAEDAFIDEIASCAVTAGGSVLLAEFPRSMIDLNRAEDEMDPGAIEGGWPQPLSPDKWTIAGFGLVRRVCRNGVPIYSQSLNAVEIERRLRTYYRPYHECLRTLIAARAEKFGRCILLDIHSMPNGTDQGSSRVDFILGNRDGRSCSDNLILKAQGVLEDIGYRVALNAPYKGREIVRRHGLEGYGAEALQIEINRKLYLNEADGTKHAGLPFLRENMTRFFRAMAAFVSAAADSDGQNCAT